MICNEFFNLGILDEDKFDILDMKSYNSLSVVSMYEMGTLL